MDVPGCSEKAGGVLMLTYEDKRRVQDEVSDLLWRHPELTLKDLIQKYRDIADFLEAEEVS